VPDLEGLIIIVRAVALGGVSVESYIILILIILPGYTRRLVLDEHVLCHGLGWHKQNHDSLGYP